MNIPDHIFKGYDIRGIVPSELNKDNLYQIAQAILKFYQDKLHKTDVSIVVGRDARITSPELYPILKKALIDGGAHLIDIGLVSTPSYYFATLHLKVDAGVQLTASHNPPEYNGLKMIMRDNNRVVKIGKPTGILDIKKLALNGVKVTNPGGSEKHVSNIIDKEIEFVFSKVDPTEIKPLKVVADPANAMAITYLKPLFERLPCELIEMNFELDGTFPAHQPDPLDFKNLKDLQKMVIKEKADLGLAPDGDGDRMFFIDEKGEIVTGAQSTALIAKELLKEYPGETILFDIRYTMTPKAVIEENGGKSVITEVGHAYITKRLHENDGLYGGESSEHNFFRWTGGAESEMIMTLLVLRAISKSGKSMSELINGIKRSYESGEYNFITDNAKSIISDMKEEYSDAIQSEIDGIAIEYPDWRFNVRTSNTEPLMRLNLEAKTDEMMKQKFEEVMNFILSKGAKPHNH